MARESPEKGKVKSTPGLKSPVKSKRSTTPRTYNTDTTIRRTRAKSPLFDDDNEKIKDEGEHDSDTDNLPITKAAAAAKGKNSLVKSLITQRYPQSVIESPNEPMNDRARRALSRAQQRNQEPTSAADTKISTRKKTRTYTKASSEAPTSELSCINLDTSVLEKEVTPDAEPIVSTSNILEGPIDDKEHQEKQDDRNVNKEDNGHTAYDLDQSEVNTHLNDAHSGEYFSEVTPKENDDGEQSLIATEVDVIQQENDEDDITLGDEEIVKPNTLSDVSDSEEEAIELHNTSLNQRPQEINVTENDVAEEAEESDVEVIPPTVSKPTHAEPEDKPEDIYTTMDGVINSVNPQSPSKINSPMSLRLILPSQHIAPTPFQYTKQEQQLKTYILPKVLHELNPFDTSSMNTTIVNQKHGIEDQESSGPSKKVKSNLTSINNEALFPPEFKNHQETGAVEIATLKSPTINIHCQHLASSNLALLDVAEEGSFRQSSHDLAAEDIGVGEIPGESTHGGVSAQRSEDFGCNEEPTSQQQYQSAQEDPPCPTDSARILVNTPVRKDADINTHAHHSPNSFSPNLTDKRAISQTIQQNKEHQKVEYRNADAHLTDIDQDQREKSAQASTVVRTPVKQHPLLQVRNKQSISEEGHTANMMLENKPNGHIVITPVSKSTRLVLGPELQPDNKKYQAPPPVFNPRAERPPTTATSNDSSISTNTRTILPQDNSNTITSEDNDMPVEILEEMIKIQNTFSSLRSKYRLIDKIGEGTFSTVYRAESLSDDANYLIGEKIFTSPELRERRKSKEKAKTFVALKRIYVTSSPQRIYNELKILYRLSSSPRVAPLLEVLREEDQIIAVLPYYDHADFREFYRDLPLQGIKHYMHELFQALNYVHSHDIIHRDIKPTNFLYNPVTKRGVLVDFGLAEQETSQGIYPRTSSNYCPCSSNDGFNIDDFQKSDTKGYPKNDVRAGRRANRAGTRGFRAPEVLFKCPYQTTKIDIWSAGVVLLTLLARRFPFFNSRDDVDALVELTTIFGLKEMQETANLHGLILDTNLSTLKDKQASLEAIVCHAIKMEIQTETLPDDSVACETYAALVPSGKIVEHEHDSSEALRNKQQHRQAFDILHACFKMDPNERFDARSILELPFFDDRDFRKTKSYGNPFYDHNGKSSIDDNDVKSNDTFNVGELENEDEEEDVDFAGH